MTYSDAYLHKAYDGHSIHNRSEIETSPSAGCFACFGTFSGSAVWDWIEPGGEGTDTGCCPYCTMDTVIGSASGFPAADVEFLRALNARIFGGPVYWDQIADPHPITGPGDWKPIDENTRVLEPGYGKSHAQDR